MSDLIGRIRAAEPRVSAYADAREAARRAAMGGIGAVSAPRRRFRYRRAAPVVFAVAAVAALAVLVLAVAGVIGKGGDAAGRIVLPGDDSPSARQVPAAVTRPGVAATIVFRPVAGVTLDQAYEQMVQVIKARAAVRRLTATVDRVERDRALVTLAGTRDAFALADVVAGSAVAVYDLDDLLVGTFSSFRKAVLRARELAPDAAPRAAYLFRNGRLIRGPAPTAADLRRLNKTLPPGSRILGLPEGYAILRRQYARNPDGTFARLRSAQFFVIRDRPGVTPLQVVGAAWPKADPTGGGTAAAPVSLTPDGRRGWDALLSAVSARAASSGQIQRIVVTINGDVEQMTTADAIGHLDTRPGSPALEFGSGIGSNSGIGLVSPVATSVPLKGSIPAMVWIAGTYRVGPRAVVLGERVDPLPETVRHALAGVSSSRADLTSVRRALVTTGPDGEWSVWNYLLQDSGALESLVAGPRPDDGFGFSCRRITPIVECGGGSGFQVYAVPAATRTLRFRSRTGSVREIVADGGWALALGPRRSRLGAPATITATALDARGQVIARARLTTLLP